MNCSSFQGEPLLAEGGDKLAGRYPAFDVTPSALITRLIGFDDLFTPERFRQRYLKGSAVASTERKEDDGEIFACLWPAEKGQLFFSGPCAQGGTGAENFDSGNAAAALGGKSRGARAFAAPSTRDLDLGQHDGHTIRAAPDSASVFIL